ncbi:hypothetical protein K7R09_25690 [Serratia ureilytica]|uniref:Uncharacterized protein n=1 Tax=Serratia ureilytica TaxID=300181 RepID=A0ABU0VME2_9GAMM|nr:hypothetical protein [Serratia ureilytica]MCU7065192.1 hypothetical protein [Serratia ureilytica]MDQ1809586.1 hypothetical protein [Serratia ureilytica]MDQ1838029.1 hypothetical protein [Serratia ureilytica]MDQ1862611.1 hypothetical protein [Serratia ureilytica]
MSASIYSMNGGKDLVWQLGNSRVVKSDNQFRYEVRKNKSSEWRKAFYGRKSTLISKVEAALPN